MWLLLWQEFLYLTQRRYQTIRSRGFHKEHHITPVEVSKDVSAASRYSPAIHVAEGKLNLRDSRIALRCGSWGLILRSTTSSGTLLKTVRGKWSAAPILPT